MGTRGLTGFVIDDREMMQYQQYDSYPGGVGMTVLNWLRDADLPNVVEQAKALQVVGDAPPTPEQIAACAPWTDLMVSNQSTSDWYCLTRKTQGDPQAILDCGYISDASSFALDSLFCEWAYVVDFDHATFEVYHGFQNEPHTEGRFADRDQDASEWYPIKRIAYWSLERLPSDEEFLALEEQDV